MRGVHASRNANRSISSDSRRTGWSLCSLTHLVLFAHRSTPLVVVFTPVLFKTGENQFGSPTGVGAFFFSDYIMAVKDPRQINDKRRAYGLSGVRSPCISRGSSPGAPLQEIGRQFGGSHPTTVLHTINNIDEMRRSHRALDRAIARLLDAFALRLPRAPKACAT